MAESAQLERLRRMHKGQQDVFAMIEKQREEMLAQIRETKIAIVEEEHRS